MTYMKQKWCYPKRALKQREKGNTCIKIWRNRKCCKRHIKLGSGIRHYTTRSSMRKWRDSTNISFSIRHEKSISPEVPAVLNHIYTDPEDLSWRYLVDPYTDQHSSRWCLPEMRTFLKEDCWREDKGGNDARC